MAETKEKPTVFAVIRVRGSMETRGPVEETMRQMRITRKNHCVLFAVLNPSSRGMLLKVRDYVTWGEPSIESIELLLTKRGSFNGKKLDDAAVKKATAEKYSTIKQLAQALHSCEAKVSDFKGLEGVFRLSPPRKGFKSIKTHFPKGALGYRGEKINELISRMV